MDRVITQMSKSDIAEVIEKGLPEDSVIFYFNPDKSYGSSGFVKMLPLTTATIANAMDEEACFIKVVTRNTDDDEMTSSDED